MQKGEEIAVVTDPQMPTGTGRLVQDYAQARAGVDFLSDAGFDVSAITIVGRACTSSNASGRLTIARRVPLRVPPAAACGEALERRNSCPLAQSAGGTEFVGHGGIGALIRHGSSPCPSSFWTQPRPRIPLSRLLRARYAVWPRQRHRPPIRSAAQPARASSARVRNRRARERVLSASSGRPRFGAATRTGRVPGAVRRPSHVLPRSPRPSTPGARLTPQRTAPMAPPL